MQTTDSIRKRQTIDQVAGVIYDLALTAEEATIRNQAGWTFDVRWADGKYVSDTDYTRATRTLSSEDLTEAIAMATRWDAGEFGPDCY
jgi:hypothetical protein